MWFAYELAQCPHVKKGFLLFVANQADLKAFCERASQSDVLAVDTEFLREKTFHPKLCLIQMSISADDIVAVDPLAINDLSGIVELFKNPAITKVFHACSQDLEVLELALGCLPAPLFDTQLAAAFLGHRMQLGYGGLVESYTGIHLPKAESHTDWSRRPLDPEQLVYAEDDVRYLPDIYRTMVKELIEQDHLSWVLPEMQAIPATLSYRMKPEESYKHLKRVGSLTRSQLAVAQKVCAWRDKVAQHLDIPRKWVLSDELIIDISKRSPKDAQALHRIRGAEQLSERNTEAILHAVKVGRACPPEQMPARIAHTHPTQEQESVLDLMYSMLRILSEKEGVAPQLVATRDDLFDFMQNKPDAILASSWRYELAGKRLEALLSGGCGLTVKDGHVEIL